MGVGEGVSGVCEPMAGPPVPFPVRGTSQLKAERGQPPPGCAPTFGRGGGGLGGCPLQLKFVQGSSPMGYGVRVLSHKFGQGFPPRGETVRVGRVPRKLPTHRRHTSWAVNLIVPRVRGVGIRTLLGGGPFLASPPLCVYACMGGFSFSTPPLGA